MQLQEKFDQRYFLASGGEFNKYYGNMELVVNWEDDGYKMRNYKDAKGKLLSTIRNKKYHFQEGLTFSKLSSKGFNARYLPQNFLFDAVGICFFPNKKERLFYFLGFLNSKLVNYFLFLFNSGMTYTGGDVSKIPFKQLSAVIELQVSKLAYQCVSIKKDALQFVLNDREFKQTAIQWGYDKMKGG